MPGITIQIMGDGAGAAEALRIIEVRMKETQHRGDEMSSGLVEAGEKIRAAFEMVGIGLGIREAVDGFKEMINRSMELAVQIGHLSQQTGISTENLSTLKYVSDQTGVSFETLTKGFKKLSTDLYDLEHGSKAAKGVAEAFKAVGVSAKDLTATGGDLFKVMELVAAKFQSMPDGFEKNAVATKLFGKAGQELIPILNQGAEGIEEMRGKAQAMGLVLDESGVKKLEEMHHKTVELKGALEGLGLSLTTTLAPAIEALIPKMEQLLGIGGQGPHGNDFIAGLRALSDNDPLGSWQDFNKQVFGHPLGVDEQNVTHPAAASAPKGGAGEGGGGGVNFGEPYNPWAHIPGGDKPDWRFDQIRGAIRDQWKEITEIDRAEGQKEWDQIQKDREQSIVDMFKSQTPAAHLDPDAYKRQALMEQIQRGIEEQEDLNAAKKENGDRLNQMEAMQAANTVGSFMNQFTEMALRGKVSFKSLIDSAISDLEHAGVWPDC
jgi:hypothetical protein